MVLGILPLFTEFQYVTGLTLMKHFISLYYHTQSVILI